MDKNFKRLVFIVLIGIVIFLFIQPSDIIADTVAKTETKKNTEMIPFYWMILIVGGWIAITLSYVSWRKYKGEQKKRMKKRFK
ncbi:sporulation protein YpjB [Virgibacillus byunsanensis]|uniref:Sporulation protein YpjB n=1 Tax=Virgibacillus byunsanensis TaxID=570945 RepID=A0ABW3LKT7_9BACI